MSLTVVLTDEEWKALEEILSHEEELNLPIMRGHSYRWQDQVRLVRERLDSAVKEQAEARAFREHVHELSEREFQGGGPR